mmetsp:Transcript_21163/g.47719  ORF Transcript_21163/g.47719 Transcript_21163/m.47719 type:complete len:240 (-) Transcript_21163:5474-6193(-)
MSMPPRAIPMLRWAIAPTSCSVACAPSAARNRKCCVWETTTKRLANSPVFLASQTFKVVRRSAGLSPMTLSSVACARAHARTPVADDWQPPTRRLGWCSRLRCTVFTADWSADRCTASTSSHRGPRKAGRTTTRPERLMVSVTDSRSLEIWMTIRFVTRSSSKTPLRVYRWNVCAHPAQRVLRIRRECSAPVRMWWLSTPQTASKTICASSSAQEWTQPPNLFARGTMKLFCRSRMHFA